MQEKLYFGKITTATPKSVLFKLCSQGIRNIIVFSFPVPGFTPIRHLGVPLFRRKFHQISWIYKAFLNPFGPKRPLVKNFFSFFFDFLGILFSRKLSFKPWELQTFYFLKKKFEDPPHRRFRG